MVQPCVRSAPVPPAEGSATEADQPSCADAFLQDGALQGWIHALTQAHQIHRALQQLFQFLLEMHGGVGREGIQLDPHIHIAARRGLVAGGGAKQADALQSELSDVGEVKCFIAMRYWHPFTESAVADIKADGMDEVVVLPLYPHFSISTSGSSFRELQRLRQADPAFEKLPIRCIRSWFDHPGYVKAMAELIAAEVRNSDDPTKAHVFFSAHGVPKSYVEEAGDPYQKEIETCTGLIMKELALQMGHDNPFTRRVIVNRVWHHLFGRGIVDTPDNLGALGTKPSHPELLDFLATHFSDQHNWSLKSFIRFLVTSETWLQSSVPSEAAKAKDPDNRLLGRMNVRRLEAEAIRDSVLTASGRLNDELYGLPIFPPLPGDIAETVKYSENKWDTQVGHEGRKRSIYIYQQRTLNMPFMQAFDSTVCDESRPRRRTSVTPLQALSLFNGDFVNEEAAALAKRVLREAGRSVPEQIRLAYRYTLSRPPSPEEAKHFGDLLGQAEDPAAALNGFCRVLLNTNEFVYID